MKGIFLLILGILSTLDVCAFETPFQRVERSISEMREQQNDLQRRRAALTNPELLNETDQMIGEFDKRLTKLEMDLSELRSRIDTRRPCPICGGKLVAIGSVRDDRSKPSKNIEVWNRSMCGNDRFIARSPICTRCWFAQSITLGWWERASAERDSFVRPLRAAIRQFPTPRNQTHIVYRQTFNDGKPREEVFFSFDGSKEYLAKARAFAREYGLHIRVDQQPRVGSSIYVSTEKSPPPLAF